MREFTVPTELTLTNSQWLRGETDSKLLRSADNKMCCLGFLALACGYTEDEIRDIPAPQRLSIVRGLPFLANLYDKMREGSHEARVDFPMTANDWANLSDEERLANLTPAFTAIGCTLKFDKES